jgi:hypothetical protein
MSSRSLTTFDVTLLVILYTTWTIGLIMVMVVLLM